MHIVINIDEEVYKRTLSYKDLPVTSNLANDYPELTHAVANGVPLPKGHGRLIDADKFINDFACFGYIEAMNVDYFRAVVQTIIEADKEVEGED